jgi:GDP-L-fucose synthase
MNPDSKVFVAGSQGLVGSAIVRNLEAKNYNQIYWVRKSNCDLRNRVQVEQYFEQSKPEYVIIAAAKVGGIHANATYPADFIYDNLMIQCNVIDAAYKHGVKKLMVLGSSCIYPKFAKQPMAEDQLLTSELEPTNDAYAIAKIAGLRMARAYRQQHGFNAISLMPTNLYGPGDNFHPENSHVLPALIRKFHENKWNQSVDIGGPYTLPVTLWGDGTAKREFLHVDDLAEACYVCMQEYDEDYHINVGTGEEVTIKELAHTIAGVVGFTGEILWDTDKPNGPPRKLLDVDKIHKLGWKHKISLREGIESTYKWYLENYDRV